MLQVGICTVIVNSSAVKSTLTHCSHSLTHSITHSYFHTLHTPLQVQTQGHHLGRVPSPTKHISSIRGWPQHKAGAGPGDTPAEGCERGEGMPFDCQAQCCPVLCRVVLHTVLHTNTRELLRCPHTPSHVVPCCVVLCRAALYTIAMNLRHHHTHAMSEVCIRRGKLCCAVLCHAVLQAEYAAALAKYKAATFTDSLSEEELAAAQARFNEGMKLFNRGIIDKALVVFDEVSLLSMFLFKLAKTGIHSVNACFCTPKHTQKKPVCFSEGLGLFWVVAS